MLVEAVSTTAFADVTDLYPAEAEQQADTDPGTEQQAEQPEQQPVGQSAEQPEEETLIEDPEGSVKDQTDTAAEEGLTEPQEEDIENEAFLPEEETIAPVIRAASASEKKLKIAMFGDSITWGSDGTNKTVYPVQVPHPIPSIIEDNLYVVCDNYGVGSIGWLKKIEIGNAFDKIASEDLSGYDVVTLCYGVNDGDSMIGAWNSDDEETIMGQFNKCIRFLQENYPDCMIIVIGPFPTVKSMRRVMAKTIFKACQNYGIGFISQQNGPLNETTVSEALPDNVHPNQEYYYRIGNWLSDEIQSITGAGSRIPIDSVSLKYSSLIYTGKNRTQSGTTVVQSNGVTLKKGVDYTIHYQNNINVGKAVLTVAGIGEYNGSISKSFKIIPKSTSVKKLEKAEKGKVRIYWRRQAVQTTGVKIQYSTDPQFLNNAVTVGVANTETTKKLISNLKSGKTYYFRIRTVKKTDGSNYYSAWSEAESIKAG